MPLPTLCAQVTPSGISAPTYAEILESLRESFREIYGADAYIDADSQDGQLLAVFALAISDANQVAIAVFNAFSPTYAQGAGLSSLVKINGIARQVPSFSTATGTVVGVVGTIIEDGVVADENGNLWNLPASVTIPVEGEVEVTITSQEPGAIIAPAGTINVISTPTLGWQSFESTTDALAGNPVESDGTLRARQAVSTSIPAQTPLDSVYSALANLDGVGRLKVYENYTNSTDGNGIPAHSICVVISGGDVTEIAETIGQKKTPGASTYGTTSADYVDPITGITYEIDFFVLATDTIKIAITGDALPGYVATTGETIKQSMADYINSLDIGEDVEYLRLFVPAYMNGSALGMTYQISGMTIAIGAGTPGTTDLPIDFNKAAICDADVDVTVTIT
jgi:uncharacterized phage protein gp47/JayE